MNSPFFSLRDFNFEHCNNYSIIFEYPFIKNDMLDMKSTKLITKQEVFPSRKSIKFTEKQIPKDHVIDIKFHYSLDEIPFLKQSLLSKNFLILEKYMVTIPNIQEEEYTLAMEFYLDPNGLFSLDKAIIFSTYFEDKIIPTTSNSKDSDKVNSTTTQDIGKDSNLQTDQSSKDEKKEEEKKEEEKKVEKIKKEKKTNCIIKLVSCSYGHNSSVMANWIQREANQEREDLTLKYAKDKRNEIETFIYTTKEKLNNDLKCYVTTGEIENILKIMQETENWLYNNYEETLNKSTIEEIYKKTITPGQMIYNRKSDWDALEEALNSLKKVVKINSNRYESQFNLAKEGKSLLDSKELEEVSKNIQFHNDFYNSSFENVRNLPRYTDCPISLSTISKSGTELDEKINKIFIEAEKRAKKLDKKNYGKADGDSKADPNISSNHNKNGSDAQMDLD